MSIVLVPYPQLVNLIDVSRCIQIPILDSLNDSNPDLLSSLISSASDVIRRYCRRDFTQQSMSEFYSGFDTSRPAIPLRQFPVLSIERVASDPQPCMVVTNNQDSNSRATVATTSSGIVLYRIASGVATTTTIAYADYITVQLLANRIPLADPSGGWSVSVNGGYETWASADIAPLQGATTCQYGGCSLMVYVEDLPAFNGPWIGPNMGFNGYGSAGWWLDAPTGMIWVWQPTGMGNIRVDYTAGFVEIPAPIQEACVQHILEMYYATTKDTSVTSENANGYSYTNSKEAISPKVQQWLRPWVAWDKSIYRG